jgi:hypothetical protein
MSDHKRSAFYAPNRSTAPRQPRAGEHLWTVQKDGRQLACELRDDGAAGVELQVSRDGELLYGRRWARCALALEEAEERKAQYISARAACLCRTSASVYEQSRCEEHRPALDEGQNGNPV